MEDQFKGILNIRYIKLHFTVMMLEDSRLPRYKSSAIRGGMGQMLLRANCIRDRKCEKCDFSSECIVQRTMYSRLEKIPQFMQSKDSVGYVIECENYKEQFEEGDSWEFNLILFGKTLCYFNLYMQALYSLGLEGIGKNRGRFRIVSVTNSRKGDILDQNGNIYMENYRIMKVFSYVNYRKAYIADRGWSGQIKFQSPLALKYQGEPLRQFHMEGILLACARRLYMLNCLENLDTEQYRIQLEEVPEIENQNFFPVSVPRYSTRHDSKMYLKGIQGILEVDSLTDEQMTLLLAGELIHIGKHTSFGFGRFHIL